MKAKVIAFMLKYIIFKKGTNFLNFISISSKEDKP